jgi:hypothetical protein
MRHRIVSTRRAGHRTPRHLTARRVPLRELSPQYRTSAETLVRSRRHRGATTSGGDVGIDLDRSCPTCGLIDCVQSVPAIRATGVHTTTGIDYYTGVGIASSGIVPVVGSATIERVHTSNLARALPLSPPQRTSGRLVALGLLMSIPFFGAIIPAIISVNERPPGASEPTVWATSVAIAVAVGVLLIFATPSAIAFGTAIRRTRRNNRIARGRPAAAAVWSAGQYCHRCGLCFWPYQPAPNVPVRQAMPPHQFTWIVWNAGDYANI